MIHSFKLNGYNIVLDVYSGSVHVVDDLAYDVIALCDARTPEAELLRRCAAAHPEADEADIAECLADVRALEAAGRLFAPDACAPAVTALRARKPVLKALCLHVAHSCNLACSYCFAGQGKYRGRDALMPYETGKRALDFLVENSPGRTNLEVDFFGGEPLLNFEVVKALTAYGRSLEAAHHKNFRFTLTTNGVLLNDEVTDFCNREMHNVVLSLDGRREVHDRMRRDHAGRGSYDTVAPNFRRFVQKRGEREYYVRGTFTRDNLDFTEDIRHMAALGFTKLSMEPVVCPPGDPYALRESDLPILYEQYEKLALLLLESQREGKPLTFYHYMLDLAHGPCLYKRVSGCGSGTEYLAVTPQGGLYPCHQFVGEPDFCMGDVWQGVTNAALGEKFGACNIYTRPACADCWAKLYCAGGCAANAWHAAGNIQGVYEYGCKLFRKRLECAIMMQAAMCE